LATVPLAALLAGETITVSFILGGALGLFGVWLGAVSGSPRVIAPDTSPRSGEGIGWQPRG
jgi:hypothetical protein